MRVFDILLKAIKYSAFDELVDRGGIRIERFPDQLDLEDQPAGIWVGNFSIKAGAAVGIDANHVYLRRKNRSAGVKSEIDRLKKNPDVNNGSIVGSTRPFLMRDLRVGFGHKVDQVLLARE
ncbi:MAG: hypothetical protein ACSHYB_00415 [Roseibacillus sp.]